MPNMKSPDPLFSAITPKMFSSFSHSGDVQRYREQVYFRLITELAVNRYKWRGLPDGIDSRFVEMLLVNWGLCVFYNDPRYDRWLALRGTGGGQINMYDNPTEFSLMANGNYVATRVAASDCAPVWCNYMRIPEIDIILMYANKLAMIDRTIDSNIIQMRTPFVVSVPESKRQTIVNTLKNIGDGDLAILGSDTFDAGADIQAFNTGIDKDQVSAMQLVKQKVLNECLTFLGINNGNQDKKERLVSAEVDANAEHVLMSRYSGLSTRRDACQRLEELGCPGVSVDYNIAPAAVEDDFTTVELRQNNDRNGGGDDGDIHHVSA